MILGTGIDLLDIRRLEKIMARHGDRFKERYFTDKEIATAEAREAAGTTLLAFAKRYTAKEACAKALGTGFIEGIFMKDIEVTNDALGKPNLTLYNGALDRLHEMTPEGKEVVIHLSLTDEPPYAQAQVIIEAL
ncbi:MAG TPA: holo-ACP synthase [Alphaproteobacteria bacterium]|nr:holo-ACP synthase [Alphaproteobacteria bacterium]